MLRLARAVFKQLGYTVEHAPRGALLHMTTHQSVQQSRKKHAPSFPWTKTIAGPELSGGHCACACWLPKSEGAGTMSPNICSSSSSDCARAGRPSNGCRPRLGAPVVECVAYCCAARPVQRRARRVDDPGQVDTQPLATVLDLAEHPAPNRFPLR